MHVKMYIAMSLIVMGIPVAAQSRFEQGDSRAPNLPISYETIFFYSGDSSRQIVNIHYRIGQNFFIFVRNEGETARTEYVAHGELLVELLNEQKISVAREIRQLPLKRMTLPKEGDHPPSIQGVFSFSVPPGNYTVVFNLDDQESGRSFIERTKKISVPAPKPAGFQVSEPMLVQTPTEGTASKFFVPTNRGGSSLFGVGGAVMIEAFKPAELDSLVLHWRLHGILDGFGERRQTFGDSLYMQMSGLLKVAAQDEGISYRIGTASPEWITLLVPLPLQKLESGMFTLDLDYRLGSTKRHQQYQFHVVWPARPFSLTDQDLAIDALRHIAKDAEIDAMLSGGATKRAEAFARFWRERSRDTTTAFNEVMAEYYYRVDDALRRFSTSKENDGYKTDRGRIYILYGPPQKSDRTLQPNAAPTEIWTYEVLHRRFIFIDAGKNGNYVLSQSENL